MRYDPVVRDPVVTDLATTAGNGDKQAWDALVERYAPLVWSICRRHELGDTDAGNDWAPTLGTHNASCRHGLTGHLPEAGPGSHRHPPGRRRQAGKYLTLRHPVHWSRRLRG